MPVLVTADLHLDLWLQMGRDPFTALPPDLLASLIVAGDLSNKPRVRWPRMIAHLARYIDPAKIHILPGNHDYYDHALDGEDRLAAICAGAGVNFAQKAEIVIGGTRFLCATLWTDFALYGEPTLAMLVAQRVMNDYRHIRHAASGYRRIRPSDTALVHADHRAWLEERLAAPFPGRTVVVTHHCPHPGLISERREELDPAYGSNLLPIIERFQLDAWLFGHTHQRAEAEAGRTLVRNVSLGYPHEVKPGAEADILMRGLIQEGHP